MTKILVKFRNFLLTLKGNNQENVTTIKCTIQCMNIEITKKSIIEMSQLMILTCISLK